MISAIVEFLIILDDTVITSLVDWICGIHRLHLGRGVKSPTVTSVIDMTLSNLMVMLYTMMRGKGRTTLLYKNIHIFLFFRKELRLLWFVRETDGEEDKTDCYIDPYLLLLTIAHCVIFKAHLALLLLFGQGCATGDQVWTTGPSGCALIDCQAGFDSAFTDSNSL